MLGIPSSPADLQKLREAIRYSQNELEPFRQQYRERLVQYAGDGCGDNPLFGLPATN